MFCVSCAIVFLHQCDDVAMTQMTPAPVQYRCAVQVCSAGVQYRCAVQVCSTLLVVQDVTPAAGAAVLLVAVRFQVL